MKALKNLLAAALLVFVIIVVFQNTDAVETKLLFATYSMSRALLLFLTLAAGIVIGLVLGMKLPSLPKRDK